VSESAEESQLDDAALPWVEGAQTVERLVQGEDVDWLLPGQSVRFIESDPVSAAPFGRPPPLGMIDQNLTHQVSRDAEELCAAVALYAVLIHEPQVGFVYQGRGLESVAGALAPEMGGGHAPELAVDEGHQPVQRGFIATAPGLEQQRYVSASRLDHSPLPVSRVVLYTAVIFGKCVLTDSFGRGGDGFFPLFLHMEAEVNHDKSLLKRNFRPPAAGSGRVRIHPVRAVRGNSGAALPAESRRGWRGHSQDYRFSDRFQALGKSYEQWSVLWWKWFLPLTVEQFNACTIGDFDQVAFLLAGPASCRGSVEAGTALFFPIANVECSSLEAPPFHGDTPAQRAGCAAGFIGGAGPLDVKIDGVSVDQPASYHVLSPDFSFRVGPDNVFGIPCSNQPDDRRLHKGEGCSGLASGDGYYLMLTPLPPGDHTIHIMATGFGVDTTFRLRVGR